MMTGPESRNKSYGFGSSNQSLHNGSRSSRRNSKSPAARNSKGPAGKMSKGKILPLAMSPTLYDEGDQSIDSLTILRSHGHLPFVDTNPDTHAGRPQNGNSHFSIHCMPLKTVTAAELEIATNNFTLDESVPTRDGILFRGNLDGYPVLVSRKVCTEKRKFFSEVEILSRLQHPNVIRLRAFCKEDNSQALVMNFVCNKFLPFYLSSKNLGRDLQWGKRAKLAIEIAKGLVYLHDTCSIIHGNIKSANLFVTQEFVPLIGDFSLARRSAVGRQILEDRSDDKEARGYLAPEYKNGGESSEKQDVYAFGVILIELISGRPAFERKYKIKFLDEWGRRTIDELKLDFSMLVETMTDPRLSWKLNFQSVLDMIQVAKLCLKEDPTERPPMRVILELLKPCAA